MTRRVFIDVSPIRNSNQAPAADRHSSTLNRMWLTLRTNCRWARPEIFYSILAFVALQMVIGAFLEFGPARLRDLEHGSKLNLLQARRADNPTKSLILVLGSSRVLHGLQCSRLVSATAGRDVLVFNYGLSGAG